MKITCKKCRRLGVSVCGKLKCALSRKPYPPGKTPSLSKGGVRRFGAPMSDYGRQLREKQIIKHTYGLRERQFKNYALKAVSSKKSGADSLVELLESRLDNVVFRLGFAGSRRMARQLISHGHILIGGRKISIPAYRVKVGETVSLKPQSRPKGFMRDFDTVIKKYKAPAWLNLDKESVSGLITARPTADLAGLHNDQLSVNSVIEFYSR